MTRAIIGSSHKLCVNCPGGVTKMEKLRMTNIWICPVCSGTEYYIPGEAITTTTTEQEEGV